MEQEKKFENTENTEQKLVRLLKGKGVEDTETMGLLMDWTIKQERLVEQSDDYPLEQIQFNLKRARLYFEAGCMDEAFDNFDAARIQALNEGRKELFAAIMWEMKSLSSA